MLLIDMDRIIYIKSGKTIKAALEEDGKLCEFGTIDSSQTGANQIIAGKIQRIMPGMNAAFVDIGQEKAAFLPLTEKTKSGKFAPLSCGDKVMVQVKREAQGTKGALVSRDVTFCGTTLMLMPLNGYIGVSSRVTDAESESRLRDIGSRISRKFGCGAVMRNNSQSADESSIFAEAEELWQRWCSVKKAFPTCRTPEVLEEPKNFVEKLIEDYGCGGIKEIVTDDEDVFKRVKQDYPEIASGLQDISGKWNSISTRLGQGMGRIHPLACGGNIIVDVCEAMTVIDVNTNSNTGAGKLEATILETNMQSCAEIARLLRLRNISGIVIIDMIDMENEIHREQVLEELRRQLACDRVKTVVHGMTSLGLIEMTRRRSLKPTEMK